MELLIVLGLLQLGDIYTTHRILKAGGRELNPILAKLFERYDPVTVMVTMKAAMMAAMIHANNLYITAGFIVVYTVVLIHNLKGMKSGD